MDFKTNYVTTVLLFLQNHYYRHNYMVRMPDIISKNIDSNQTFSELDEHMVLGSSIINMIYRYLLPQNRFDQYREEAHESVHESL